MLEWARRKLNERHERQTAYQKRVDQLVNTARPYRMSDILDRVRANISDQRSGEYRGILPNISGRDLQWVRKDDIEVASEIDHGNDKSGQKAPSLRVAVIQRSTGISRSRGESRIRDVNETEQLAALTLNEAGEFWWKPSNGRSVLVGTMKSIRDHDALQAAIDDLNARV